MTETLTRQVLYLDPRDLHPDPDNPRGELRGIDAMAASILAQGILEPLTVRPREAGGWWIVRGHRRHAGALQAGEASVPCLDEGLGGDDDPSVHQRRAIGRLVENLQRDDFTPAERAQGFQQLLDLDLSEDEMVRATGVSAQEVAATLRLAASKQAMATATQYDLSFEDAAAIAEFEDDEEALRRLTRALDDEPEYLSHVLSELREDRRERDLLAAEIEVLAEDGWRAVTEWAGRRLDDLAPKAGAKKAITPAQHKDCPGAVVYLSVDYQGGVRRQHMCTDPVTHGHVPLYGGSLGSSRPPAADQTPAQREQASSERRLVVAGNKLARAAEPVRRKFVQSLLLRRTLPPGTARFVSEFISTCYMRVEHHDEMFQTLTGTSRESYVKALPDNRVLLALVAYVAAELEHEWGADSWRHPNEKRRLYLGYLRGAGYTPALVERVLLGEAKATEMLRDGPPASTTRKAPPSVKQSATVKRAPARRSAGAKKKATAKR